MTNKVAERIGETEQPKKRTATLQVPTRSEAVSADSAEAGFQCASAPAMQRGLGICRGWRSSILAAARFGSDAAAL